MKRHFLLAFVMTVISCNAVLSQFQLPALTEKSILLSNGTRLEYAEQGDPSGIPVLFLHGYTDSWHSFETVLPYLPMPVHAFAISLRGHGDSDRPETGYLPKDFANDIADFIRKRNLSSAVLVGHSMGGMIVQQFALDHPQLLRGAVIAGSAPTLTSKKELKDFYATVLKLNDPIDTAFVYDFQLSTVATPVSPDCINKLTNEGLKVPSRIWKSVLASLLQQDYTRSLYKIDVPVLILWGDQDGICSRRDQDIMQAEITRSQLIVYKGTGHGIHWAEPAQFARDLLNFIGRVY